MDVEVDENDWNLHLEEAGASDVSKLKFTSLEKFKLMYILAEIFVQLHKRSKFPEYFGNDSDKKEFEELVRARNDLTKTILERAPF